MLIVIGRVSKEMCRHEQKLSNVFPNLFPTVQSCDLLVRLEELRSSFTEHDLSLTLQRITYYAVFLFVNLSALHNVFREINTENVCHQVNFFVDTDIYLLKVRCFYIPCSYTCGRVHFTDCAIFLVILPMNLYPSICM